MKHGLPNFHVPDTLESGFFCPVSFESLQGHKVAIKYDNSAWSNVLDIDNSHVLYWVFRAFNVKMVSSVQQGFSDKALGGRMTLSMSEKDFYRFYDKMSEMHDFFFGEKPEVQLDLFRTNAPRP